MKNLILLIPVFLASACYKLGNAPPDNSKPVYNVYMGQYLNLRDTMGYTGVSTNGDSTPVFFDFSLVSGNPQNYPFTCKITGLPSGILATPDSFVFKLNYACVFRLSATTPWVGTDTGAFPVYLTVTSNVYGVQQYPISLTVTSE